MKFRQISSWHLIFLFCITQISNAQQNINLTQPQNEGKGLKALAEAKNETVEVKVDQVRKEMRDFMRECGVDVPEEEDAKGYVEVKKDMDRPTNTNKLGNLNMAPMASDNLNDGRKKKKKKGTYPTSYGNSGRKRKNKKRRGNNDCDDDMDNDSCEDDDDDSDSDEDDDDRRRGKGKKGRGGQRGGRNKRDTSTLVEQFNVTVGGEAIDGENTEMNENFKNKKGKRRGGGNRDYDDDEDEDEDDDDAPNRCGGGRNKGGGRGKGKNRGSQGGGGKNKKKGGKGGRTGGNKGGGGKKHGGGGGDGFGGGEEGHGHGGGGGNPFETGAGGLGPGMGDHYGYPGLSGGDYFHGNPYGYGSYAGYIRQLGDSELISRIKRQEDKIDCVSQCVFGYLEVLDDNRVPSETALISYYQEKIINNDKKSDTITNVRRCFARLVATDTEDGCKFSKEVSKCLKLDLDP